MIPTFRGNCDPFFGSISYDALFNDPKKPPGFQESLRSAVPHSTVLNVGEDPELIYILRSGEADVRVATSHKIISNRVQPDRMYGLIEAVSGGQMWYSMRTLTDCTFTTIRADKFIASLSRDPALCFRLAQILSRMNRELLSAAG